MKRKRHAPEEVIRELRQADKELAGGKGIEDVCLSLEISPVTYHRWAKGYAGVKRLKQLGKENTRLKKLVAEQGLDMAILKGVAEGKR